MPKLTVRAHSVDTGVLRLRLAGEADLASSDLLDAAIRVSLLEENVQTLLVDLDEVTFIDPVGVRVLLDGHRLAADQSIVFRISNPRKLVWRVLALTGALETLSQYGD